MEKALMFLAALLTQRCNAQTACTATSSALVAQLGTATNFNSYNDTRNKLLNTTDACYVPWVQPPFYSLTTCSNQQCTCDSTSANDPKSGVCLPTSWQMLNKQCQESKSLKFELIVEAFVNSTRNPYPIVTASLIFGLVFDFLFTEYRDLDRKGQTYPMEVLQETCFNTYYWLKCNGSTCSQCQSFNKPFEYVLDGTSCKAAKGSICLLQLNTLGIEREVPAVYLNLECQSGAGDCKPIDKDEDFDFVGQLDISICGGGKNPFSNGAAGLGCLLCIYFMLSFFGIVHAVNSASGGYYFSGLQRQLK